MIDLAIHPEARDEYETAIEWYQKQSASAAARFIAEVDVAITAIHRQPERFTRIDDDHYCFLLDRFPYFVAYRYTRQQVTVVAIRHTSRDQSGWIER
jgi:plasmid stabilization system protein ParE